MSDDEGERGRAGRSPRRPPNVTGLRSSSGSDQAEPSTTKEASTAAESASQLLEPAEFARYMEDNPDVPVVNVHIPYEGHIDGTDSFVAFDKIADWDGLPEDRSAHRRLDQRPIRRSTHTEQVTRSCPKLLDRHPTELRAAVTDAAHTVRDRSARTTGAPKSAVT